MQSRPQPSAPVKAISWEGHKGDLCPVLPTGHRGHGTEGQGRGVGPGGLRPRRAELLENAEHKARDLEFH